MVLRATGNSYDAQAWLNRWPIEADVVCLHWYGDQLLVRDVSTRSVF